MLNTSEKRFMKSSARRLRSLKEINTKQAYGFSLIESAVALTILGAILAYSAPIFLHAKMNNNKNEIRTGALAISQKIFDKNRGKRFDLVGKDDTGADVATEETDEESGGRKYIAKVIHCPIGNECDENFKVINIEIRDVKTNSLVYEVQGGLTNFR
jgi:prepilin-type N-terminal cleavage/methylation domain-containing protein